MATFLAGLRQFTKELDPEHLRDQAQQTPASQDLAYT